MAARESKTSFFSSARSDVAELRGRLSDLRAELQKVVATPRDRATIERLIDEQIAHHADPEAFRFAALASPAFSAEGLAGEFNTRFATFKFAEAGRYVNSEPFDARLFQFLAAFDPAKLKAMLLASAPSGGISDAKRAAEISRIEREILLTSLAEELACREIEEFTGSHFPRRRDADVAILLAPVSELAKGA
ncbi:hypothetical protein [Bosea massiliensis]|uniref:Uncharacterized protein n=1 Tax=Bosea massiliensis TaxID=151419 RepID=A0ABW0NZS9_9HYPH